MLTMAAGRRITNRDCRYMVTRSEMQGLQGWFLNRLGCFPIDQGTPSIINKYNPPDDVGIDRLVDSVAAVKLYGNPCIILDIGTCLVFNAITENNEYIGGSILPGLNMASESLSNSTALLKPVELKIPTNIIGNFSALKV